MNCQSSKFVVSTPGKTQLNRWIVRGRGRRVVVTDYTRIIGEEAPAATRTTNAWIGVDVIAHRGRETVTRPGNGVAALVAAGKDAVDQTGLRGSSRAAS